MFVKDIYTEGYLYWTSDGGVGCSANGRSRVEMFTFPIGSNSKPKELLDLEDVFKQRSALTVKYKSLIL